jgi:hypothetical protein
MTLLQSVGPRVCCLHLELMDCAATCSVTYMNLLLKKLSDIYKLRTPKLKHSNFPFDIITTEKVGV